MLLPLAFICAPSWHAPTFVRTLCWAQDHNIEVTEVVIARRGTNARGCRGNQAGANIEFLQAPLPATCNDMAYLAPAEASVSPAEGRARAASEQGLFKISVT